MTRQLTFRLPSKTALGQNDYFVSPGNKSVVETVQNWQNWPLGKMILVGPEASGKTHLAHVWAEDAGAQIISAIAIGSRIQELAAAPIAVEDIHQIINAPEAQTALFHLHNLALANNQPMLMTSAKAPAHLQMELPDLASRLQGSAMISLSPPDDPLLTAVLVKLFADRQIAIAPDLIGYLLPRMDRSLAAVNRLVEALDLEALALRKPVTKSIAASVLDKLGQTEA